MAVSFYLGGFAAGLGELLLAAARRNSTPPISSERLLSGSKWSGGQPKRWRSFLMHVQVHVLNYEQREPIPWWQLCILFYHLPVQQRTAINLIDEPKCGTTGR